MLPLVVVAVTTETARTYAEQRGRTHDAVLLATGSRAVDLPADVMPNPREIVLLEGWDRGRYARVAESQIRKALARRSGEFDQCQHDTAFAIAA